MPNRPQLHRWLYFGGLALVLIGLPFTKVLMSIGLVVLSANFLLEGKFKQKLDALKSNKTIWLLAGVFLMHALSLLWTEDLSRGLKDLNIKTPLILFPIIIGLSYKLSKKHFDWLTHLFTLCVLIASIVSTVLFIQHYHTPGYDFREISIFTSHIRFSLMVVIAYIISLHTSWNARAKSTKQILFLIAAVLLSIFVFILQAMTGIIVWLASSYFLLLYTLWRVKSTSIKWSGIAIIVITPLICTLYLVNEIDHFYPDQKPIISEYDRFAPSGEMYTHDTTKLMLENGHYVYHYQARAEMQRVWNRRSDIYFPDGKDANGNFIYSTVLRYLTSKGLRKDSMAVMSLTDDEIEAIENGITNTRYLDGNPIDDRIYTIIWELDNLKNQENPEGHSVAQRFTFIKTGWQIFSQNRWFGVGAGDVNNSFQDQYVQNKTTLKKKYRMRAHNQYLTIAIATGIIGFVVFLVSIVLPFFTLKSAHSFLYIGFAIIILMSMLNEDTLETQAGATLYGFFNAFLLYALASLSPKETSAEE